MLVDLLPHQLGGGDPGIRAIMAMMHGSNGLTRIAEGVYECPHFNPTCEFSAPHNEYPSLVRGNGKDVEDYFGPYGVCDSWGQVLEQCPMLLDKNNKYILTVTPVRKSEQSPSGGWRWHKWGEYIGTQEQTCEYLYDEPKVELVYCYHVFQLNF